MIALDGSYDPAAAPEPVTICLRVADETITVRAHGRSHQVTEGATAEADLSVEAGRDVFLAWATGQLDEAGALGGGMTVTDGVAGLRRLRSLYPVSVGAR